MPLLAFHQRVLPLRVSVTSPSSQVYGSALYSDVLPLSSFMPYASSPVKSNFTVVCAPTPMHSSMSRLNNEKRKVLFITLIF